MQADYDRAWGNLLAAFREICDALPDVRVSLEHKPTDENSRYAAGTVHLRDSEPSACQLCCGTCCKSGDVYL